MNFAFLKFHRHLFVILFVVLASVVAMTIQLGDLKTFAQIDFFDAAGEGGITLMTLLWLFFTLISRPAGKVTHWLFVGLTLTNVSMLLDFMDEFVQYPADSAWLSTIESLPAPIGMVILSVALYQWHLEQMTINAQLRRTERYYRDHSLTDFVTGLYSAKYMKNQLERECTQVKKRQSTVAVMMIDIRNFDCFNRKHGDQQGDILLREVAQLILMNLRDEDLACRYASDRFVIMLPNTTLLTAQAMANDIELSISNLAFKFGPSSVANYQHVTSCALIFDGQEGVDDMLSQLNNAMLATKHAVNLQASA
ncbi:GGDEF domain-containing protein [Algibacillus agarilyticus]|uniref:GGDEF domain-containing protein n=1 Tax=Algibacillus agarilyticus TaxID=2234133 RepID=UPI000DD04E75|nr:diguanylate cyclase [Algibacillus agarilyticus]